VAYTHDSAHCTFAVTDAVPLMVKVHELRFDPPLEQAPDQIAERPVVTRSVIEVPIANDAEPAPPVETLMPAGLDATLWPLRPVTFTVSVALCGGGGGGDAGETVSVVVTVAPLQLAEIVTGVDVLTAVVEIGNVKVLAPPDMVTLAGTVATLGLLLDSDTVALPPGGGPDNRTVPLAPEPPVTSWGLPTHPAASPGADRPPASSPSTSRSSSPRRTRP
jgi:hypothetical protein